jgi:gliding motility-associated-like protein
MSILKNIISLLMLLASIESYSQTIIIHEISQGLNQNNESPEYVEFLVVGTPCASSNSFLDMRHMIIDDNNGTFASGSGVGIANGAMRFGGSSFWQNIPVGTLIVIYNAEHPNNVLPPDDYSLSDGNHRLIIPSTSNLIDGASDYPNLTSSLYPISTSPNWIAGGTDWINEVIMRKDGDSFQIRDSNAVLIHSLSWGDNVNPILHFNVIADAASPVFHLVSPSNSANSYNQISNWAIGSLASQTPGKWNSYADSAWIYSMIGQPNTSDTSAISCDSFTWYGNTYTQSGTATHTLTNASGCDSIVTLHLTIGQSNSGDTTAVACDSFAWYGNTYTQSGTDTHTFTNVSGCDSIVTLHVTIGQSNSGDTTAVACNSFSWYGNSYTQSGTDTHTFTNVSGCDSIVTLHLTIGQSSSGDTTAVACNSFTWHGNTYTQSGTNTHTFTNASGCDSIVTLHVTIGQSNAGDTTAVACNSFSWYGNTYTQSGTDTHTFTNASGCDSIVTLHLTINQPSTSTETINACDTYTWHGTTYTSSNFIDTWLGVNGSGCDSLVTLNLTIHQASASLTTFSVCEPIMWNGQTYAQSGSYTYTTMNFAGCDSVATLNLTINNPSNSVTLDSACESFFWNGHTYTSSGSYIYNTTNATGCDSIAVLQLFIEDCSFNPDSSSIYIPNVFTPNNDLVNDTFKIITYDGIIESGYIFNRWGELIYGFSEKNKSWDGTDLKTGKQVSDGTYMYLITFKPTYSQTEVYQGHVTIIR